MQTLTLDSESYGIQINATLTFTDFDPTGGAAALEVIHQPERSMSLVGAVASYVTTEDDFQPGKYVALVVVTKTGVRVASERFQLKVL